MHSKKWSKGLKKMLSIGAVGVMLIPTVTQAISNQTKSTQITSEFTNQLELTPITIQEDVNTETDEEISIIVEFKSLPLAVQKSANKPSTYSSDTTVKEEHSKFKEFLNNISKEKSSGYKIDQEYTQLFNGVSMKIKGTDVEKLLESGVVKSIWNNGEVKLDLPQEKEAKSKDSSEIAPFMEDSVPAIGVDKLHAEGLTGKGIKVGVLDTGIDYNHPDLTSSYKGEKSEGKEYSETKGWDFVDNDSDPMEATYEDWKNSGQPEFMGSGAYYTAHGTHVSGTIAASPENDESELKTKGVAPDAELYGYRVLGPYGSGSFDWIMAAVEKAYTDGMDVINLSLGGSFNSALNPITTVCNNAMTAGLVTVIANGNAGPYEGTVGTPGTAPLPISVGASNVSLKIDTFELKAGEKTVNGKLLSKDFTTSIDSLNDTFDVVDCGFGYESDFENKNLTGKVALIQRGDISFDEKLVNAKRSGAVAAIVYNNVGGEIPYYLGEGKDYVPSIALTKEAGETLKSQANSEVGFQVTLSKTGQVETKGDELADFSSRGPTDTEDIKPDVVAPGVSVMSTVPEYINHSEDGDDYSTAYARLSGTSMASPHVAGVSALIVQDGKEKSKEYSAFDVKTKLMNTAQDMATQYAVNEMGAGRINAYEAVHTDLSIQVLDKDIQMDDNYEDVEIDDITGALSYKYLVQSEGANESSKSMDVKITNQSDKPKKLEISVEFLGTEYGGKDANKNGVKLEVPQAIEVGANESKTISPKIVALKDAELGLYQGYIRVKDGEKVTNIPFSTTHVKEGFNSDLNRVSISSEAELSGITNQGVDAYVNIGSPIDKIKVFVRDFDTNKIIGYMGEINTKGVRPGKYKISYIVGAKPTYFLVKDEKEVMTVPSILDEGKYKIELAAIDSEGKTTTNEHPLLVDNEQVTLESNIKKGVYEISQENLETEKDDNGNDVTAFWVKGKISDTSIEKLRSMGVETSAKDLVVEHPLGDPIKVDENGNFRVPITEDMPNVFDKGCITYPIKGVDLAISHYVAPQNSIFVNEGTPYVRAYSNKAELKKSQTTTVTLEARNVKNASKLTLPLQYEKGLEPTSVKLNKEAEKELKKQGYKADLSYEIDDSWEVKRVTVKVEIKDAKTNKPVNIENLDADLVDVNLKLVDDSNFTQYVARIECVDPYIVDKDGKQCDIAITNRVMYDNIKVIPKNSSAMIQGNIIEGVGWQVLEDNFTVEKLATGVWIEGANGKRYDSKYYAKTESFINANLPVSSEEFTAIIDVPGHFTSKSKFRPYKKYEGKLISKYSDISGAEFDFNILAGETNKDGVIDIMDAINVADNYNKDVTTEEMKNLDFNFDNKVDSKDMDYIVNNYLKVNYQQDNRVTPKGEHNGKTLEKVLEEIGYVKSKQELPKSAIDPSKITYFQNEAYTVTQGEVKSVEVQGKTIYTVKDKEHVYVYNGDTLVSKIKGNAKDVIKNL